MAEPKNKKSKIDSMIKELDGAHPHSSVDEKSAFKTDHLVTSVPVTRYSQDPREDDLSLMKELREEIDKDHKIFDGLDPEKYFDIWRKKYDEYERLQFFRFVFSNTDMNDPYQVSKIQEQFPEIYADAERQVDETADLYDTLADITYRGVKDRKDWLYAYNISRGKVQFDNNTLQKLMGVYKGEDAIRNEDQYEFGILAPKRFRKMKYEQQVQSVNPFMPFTHDGTLNKNGKNFNIKRFTDVIGNSLGRIFDSRNKKVGLVVNQDAV